MKLGEGWITLLAALGLVTYTISRHTLVVFIYYLPLGQGMHFLLILSRSGVYGGQPKLFRLLALVTLVAFVTALVFVPLLVVLELVLLSTVV